MGRASRSTSTSSRRSATRYVGRRLYLLYNPLTGSHERHDAVVLRDDHDPPAGDRRPPAPPRVGGDQLLLLGSGWSRVGGRRYEWGAGDLMLTAPGWMIHHHASDDDDRVYELTVQDQPLNIAMESLLWQEDLKRAAAGARRRGRLRDQPRPRRRSRVIDLPAERAARLAAAARDAVPRRRGRPRHVRPPGRVPRRRGQPRRRRVRDERRAERAHRRRAQAAARGRDRRGRRPDPGRSPRPAASRTPRPSSSPSTPRAPAPTRCWSSRRTTSARRGAASSRTSSTSPSAPSCRCCVYHIPGRAAVGVDIGMLEEIAEPAPTIRRDEARGRRPRPRHRGADRARPGVPGLRRASRRSASRCSRSAPAGW